VVAGGQLAPVCGVTCGPRNFPEIASESSCGTRSEAIEIAHCTGDGDRPGGDPGTQVATGNRCGQWVSGSRWGDPEEWTAEQSAAYATGSCCEASCWATNRDRARHSVTKRAGRAIGWEADGACATERSRRAIDGEADEARGARRTVGAIRWRANAPHASRSAPTEQSAGSGRERSVGDARRPSDRLEAGIEATVSEAQPTEQSAGKRTQSGGRQRGHLSNQVSTQQAGEAPPTHARRGLRHVRGTEL